MCITISATSIKPTKKWIVIAKFKTTLEEHQIKSTSEGPIKGIIAKMLIITLAPQ